MTQTAQLTLSDFLLARIAEDEADVAAILRQNPRWEADGADVCDRPDLILAHVRGDYAAAHIARWDPARVLAECEAKRRIVGQYQQLVGAMPPDLMEVTPVGHALREVLWFLAMPYAAHPDYRQEWRP